MIEVIKMAKIILSLDGGGIRGAATAHFLEKVEQTLQIKYNKSIRDCVDFYAGTSTGSIIALGLATTNLPISNISSLYNYENAKEIFKEQSGLFRFDGVNVPKYHGGGKTSILEKTFQQARISDVPKDKHVLAVAYEITTRNPVVFKSTQEDHLNVLSSEIADASSAAPTYFPTKEIIDVNNHDLWLIDGGVVANNPTMCAITESRKIWHVPLDDLWVLSVGTGYRTRKINGPDSRKWGALEWFTQGHIIDLLSDEKIVGYQAKNILSPGHYIRVNADMRKQKGMTVAPDDAMDDIDSKNIDKLKAMGDWWFQCYGSAVVDFLCQEYSGPSLDEIDPATGAPFKIN